jgi:hypothetical protein
LRINRNSEQYLLVRIRFISKQWSKLHQEGLWVPYLQYNCAFVNVSQTAYRLAGIGSESKLFTLNPFSNLSIIPLAIRTFKRSVNYCWNKTELPPLWVSTQEWVAAVILNILQQTVLCSRKTASWVVLVHPTPLPLFLLLDVVPFLEIIRMCYLVIMLDCFTLNSSCSLFQGYNLRHSDENCEPLALGPSLFVSLIPFLLVARFPKVLWLLLWLT